jgi:hypothetical protein
MAEDFEQWLPLYDLALSHLPKYGNFPAVYVLRDATTGEILKYGCTSTLRRRILGNYVAGIGGMTTQRIHGELFDNEMIGRVEIAWFETLNQAEAKSKETEFRRAYIKIHGKRPIWDLLD